MCSPMPRYRWLAWTDSPDNTGLKTSVLIGAVFCLISLAWLRHFNFGREQTHSQQIHQADGRQPVVHTGLGGFGSIHESSQGHIGHYSPSE